MSDEEIINLWNMGLSKMAVVSNYMREHNRKARGKKDMKRITKEQALKHVEPILFDYEMARMRGYKEV